MDSFFTILLLFILFYLSNYSSNYLLIENMVLRQQLNVYKGKKRHIKLRQLDRLFWILIRKIFPAWKNSLIIVKPETVVTWHRSLFKNYWKWISRKRGRPPKEESTISLIKRISRENPSWGPTRIQGELVALGRRASINTIRKYMVKKWRPNSGKAQSWKEFISNHREVIQAMDFFTIPSLTFTVYYCFFIIDHSKRKIVHFNVTTNPNLDWVKNQIRAAFPYDETPKYLLSDNDPVFVALKFFLEGFGIKQVRTAYRSPWQNGIAERWVRTCREECMNHIIPMSENHLRRVLREYVAYYNAERTHSTLNHDSPEGRKVTADRNCNSELVSESRVGGLHHVYSWRKAA